VTASPRRQRLLLGVLFIAALTLAVLRWPSNTINNAVTGVGGGGGSQASRPGNPVGDIRLDTLENRADGAANPSRDVFRFEAKRTAPPPSSERPTNPAPVDPGPPVPTGPLPPPPIPLRYIGYLDRGGQAPRIAVLSDGRGNVFNGKEGDIIEGRYRVLRIGTDSADLIYVDGRGRQTIRLSGQ
jgi:hypothetical protein